MPSHLAPSLKIFLVGLLISLLGSLPLGTMNVVAMQIALREGPAPALIFSGAAVLVEMIYARIALVGIHWVQKHLLLFRLFQWLTVLLLLALALASLIAAIRMSGMGKLIPIQPISPILLGLLLSATNPMHIIFWFGWSGLLMEKKILVPRNVIYNIYVAGIGIGSIVGYMVFVFGGNFLVNQMKANQNMLNWVIGLILLLTALIQWIKIMKRPSAQLLKKP
jgi:threonine/homoserine/homoserine lactone efflux protein